ncbi:hypothetical protein HYU11_01795 [Candidatus Woesearchaeota archaeon]|nr:hypothetical protein [Candidatus Woesearchaeota archaeon]
MLNRKLAALLPAFLLFPVAAHAHCPLCTAAVGSAAVAAKFYGVDTSILGVLIGAFGLSTGIWAANSIKKKVIKFQTPLIVIGSFLLTTIPLLPIMPETFYFPLLIAGQSGSLMNKVYWINRMLVGGLLGAMATLIAYYAHNRIKALRGKVLFPYQGIAFTLGALALTGISLYIMVR